MCNTGFQKNKTIFRILYVNEHTLTSTKLHVNYHESIMRCWKKHFDAPFLLLVLVYSIA